MSWAADGQGGNGLHLEKNEANSFKFIAFVLEKIAKTQIMVYFLLWEIHLISSSLFSISISCTTKVLFFEVEAVFAEKPENVSRVHF